MKRIALLIAVVMLVVVGCGPGQMAPTATTAPTSEPTATPEPTPEPTAEPTAAPTEPPAGAFAPADIANDEGGPVVVSGEFNWTSGYIQRHYEEPVAVLMDFSHAVLGEYTEFVPSDGQIMGVLTRPLAPSPTAYEVELPIRPDAQLVDVDNDGEDDTGVQVYAAVFSSNLVGDSYLQQLEQEGFDSILTDPLTGRIREGTLLVYAPDDQQGFPAGAGPDGEYFSADDPAVALPAGYTVATLSPEGQVTFDRSQEATMDILEPASQASPDFSDQGYVESFNSLIDLLKVRYSYTELRGLDWEAIRAEYLPRMEEAEREEDFETYFFALSDMALSIRDAHVQVVTLDHIATAKYLLQATEPYAGGFGVHIVETSDGQFVVTYMDPEGPGADAGWQVGTEILSVDGVPLAERIDTIPLLKSSGNPEAIRVQQIDRLLGFPVGTEVTVEYLQPGENQPRSATVIASYTAVVTPPEPQISEEEISFRQLDNGYYYIQWRQFLDDVYKAAVWRKFMARAHNAPGIVIDLRNNTGGGTTLMYTMMSYLFSADDPALLHWIDSYNYDDQSDELVLEFATDYKVRSPEPDLTYTGQVAVLVSEKSASAAEYFPQFLQREGRAIVVGEHGTEGAGGYLESVAMPGDLGFFFTKSRTTFAGTDEYNLEAKGVSLDVRVPITLENELAKQEGTDVVLEAAVAALEEEAGRQAAAALPGTSWKLAFRYTSQDLLAGAIAIEDPTAYTLTFGEGGTLAVQADCNLVAAEYVVEGFDRMTIALGPSTLAACPEGSYSEGFLNVLAEVDRFEASPEGLVLYRGVQGSDDWDAFFFEPSEPTAGGLPADTVAQLDTWLTSQVWTEGGNPTGAAPGLVLLVDTPEGRYFKAAGVSSLEEGTPMQVDDILEIGSNTKSMVIAVMMQLQEEDLLSFDDKLSDWLPDLAARIPNGDQVDLRLMANMATGFWDYGDPIIGEGAGSREAMLKAYTPEELMEYAIENGTPDFLPGESFKYSNTNYILLGMIAEKASGQSLAQLFQERIFDPLGMETAVLIEDVPQEGEITTQGYWWQPDGTRLNTTDWNASQGWAAGANAMTAEDLLAYGRALGAGELFQDPDSLAQMLPYNDASLFSLGGAYGLGLIDFGHGYWGHGGQSLGFQSLWYTNPEKEITVVGLTNSATYPGWQFVSAIGILEGKGLRPLQYISLLPIAEQFPPAGISGWVWTELGSSEGLEAISGSQTLLAMGPDGSAKLNSLECGPVGGTYTTTPDLGISVDLVADESFTCPEGEPLLQLLDLLGNAESWRFENGRLVISWADGDGELVFEPAS